MSVLQGGHRYVVGKDTFMAGGGKRPSALILYLTSSFQAALSGLHSWAKSSIGLSVVTLEGNGVGIVQCRTHVI